MNWCDGRPYRMKWALLAVSTRTQHRVHITIEQRMASESKNVFVFLEKSTFFCLRTELIEFFHAGRSSTCYSMNVTQVILHRRLWTYGLDIRHAKTNGLRSRSVALVALVVNARHGERNKGTGQGMQRYLLDLVRFGIRYMLTNSRETTKIDTHGARKSLDDFCPNEPPRVNFYVIIACITCILFFLSDLDYVLWHRFTVSTGHVPLILLHFVRLWFRRLRIYFALPMQNWLLCSRYHRSEGVSFHLNCSSPDKETHLILDLACGMMCYTNLYAAETVFDHFGLWGRHHPFLFEFHGIGGGV